MPETTERTREATPLTGARVGLPPTDIRRKRPPALSFLLRWETLRRLSRVLSLLALDFVGVFAAIFTALMLKAVVQHGTWAWHESFVEARQTVAFAYLVTALLFARSGLYAERAQRPGLPRIVSSLFQVTVVALIFALVNGEEYSSYYIFYGTLFFAIVYVSTIRWLYEKATGVLLRAAGYRRRAVLVGSGSHIEEVAPRARRRGPRARRHARLHLAHAAARQRPALARPDRGPAGGARAPPRAGGHHRRPGLPGGARGRAGRPVPPARGHRADRALDDGDPGAPRGVRARRVGAAVRAAPAGVRRLRLLRQAQLRLRRRAAPAARAQPAAAGDRDRGRDHLARRRCSTARSGPGSAASRSRASSSARCARTPTRCRPTSSRSTRPPARCSRSAATRG